MFHPWPRLPTELKLEVLSHALGETRPIDHRRHVYNLGTSNRCVLSAVIGTRNRDFVELALDACQSIYPERRANMLTR